MDKKNCLEAEEMATIASVFKECFSTELTKYPKRDRDSIDVFILNNNVRLKLHTLFTAGSLSTLTEEVFSNIPVRDFILCLTDQFRCVTAMSDFGDRSIEHSIAYGLDSPEMTLNSSILVPEKIYSNMELSGVLILKTLNANHWLLTIILIYLFSGRINISNIDTVIDKNKS